MSAVDTVIVSWNGARYLLGCLAALAESRSYAGGANAGLRAGNGE